MGRKKGSLNTIFEGKHFGVAERRKNQRSIRIPEHTYLEIQAKAKRFKDFREFMDYLRSDEAPRNCIERLAAINNTSTESVEIALQEVYKQMTDPWQVAICVWADGTWCLKEDLHELILSYSNDYVEANVPYTLIDALKDGSFYDTQDSLYDFVVVVKSFEV